MSDVEEILAECKQRLERGYAVATGIGLFVVLFRDDQTLLRTRLEVDSIYQQNLSGKWEMTGGGVELQHFQDIPPGRYQETIRRVLAQELLEEAGLELLSLPSPFLMASAWLQRGYEDRNTRENRMSIDLAFVRHLSWERVRETDEFQNKLSRGELGFFSRPQLAHIEIVSPRTRFLIESAFASYEQER